jgi:hypothetical protein
MSKSQSRHVIQITIKSKTLFEFSVGFLKEFTYQKGIFTEIIKIIFRELRKIYVRRSHGSHFKK